MASVEAGNGVVLVARSLSCLAGPRLKFLTISPAPDPLVVGLFCRKDESSPVVQNFITASFGD